MGKRKSSDVSDGQEKITKYVLRSRIPLKFKEKEVSCKGIDNRKRISSPVTASSSSENPGSVLKLDNANNAEVKVMRKGMGIKKSVAPVGRLRSTENPSSAPKLKDAEVMVTRKGTSIRKKSLLPVRRLRSSENSISCQKLKGAEVKVTSKETDVSASPTERLRSLENRSSVAKLKDAKVRATRNGTNVRKKSASPMGRLRSSENPSSALKLNDVNVKVTRKGTGDRKRSLLPVRQLRSSENSSSCRQFKGAGVKVTSIATDVSASPVDRLRSSENPSSSDDKQLTEIRTPRSISALWNRSVILETAAQNLFSDPYDFDTYMTEYDLKENRQAKRKCTKGKALPNKKSKNSGFVKPKTVGAVKKKPLNARNVIPLKETSATTVGECVTKSTVVDAPSGELANVMEVEVERRHFEELEVCVEQKMANKRSEISVSLFQDPDVLPPATTPFPTKDKLMEQECCTSTPQTAEDVTEPVGPSSISPILKASRPRLQVLDLNISGFSAENNARTYRRDSHPKACRIVELAPAPVVEKNKKLKRKKKYKLPKHFDKWATNANETLIEAENFELVIE